MHYLLALYDFIIALVFTDFEMGSVLSANSDPKLVMKGITHGACDYLVKPVRVEELRNIWQHVVRKKKVIPKLGDRSKSDDRDQQGSEGGQGPSLIGNVDQNGKINRKRKDEEEEGEGEENDHDDDDESSTQKKPRVVWSIDLHGKFVEAVNQLGVESELFNPVSFSILNMELIRINIRSLHIPIFVFVMQRLFLSEFLI